ncbi:MAG: MFS transporter [Bacillota bacterium]
MSDFNDMSTGPQEGDSWISKIKNRKPKTPLTDIEKTWALYDAGNSAIYMFFILIGVSIGELAYGTYFATNQTQTMSIFNASTGVIVALLGPILGSIADNKGRKKSLFKFFVYMGVGGCYFSLIANFASLASFDSGLFAWGFFVPFAISIFLILIGLGGSLLFYDSMLGDVTTEERSDIVSSKGFAYGYIFSLIPFSICLAIYYFFMTPTDSVINYGFTEAGSYAAIRLAITACLCISGTWWLCFSRPLIKKFEQKTGVDPVPNQIRNAFKKLGETFREVKKYKAAFLFLLAFFFYINGVNTIIALSATYAKDIFSNNGSGIDNSMLNVYLIVALMCTQVIACGCSILFGNLSQKVSPKKLIILSVFGYLAFVVYGIFMNNLFDFFLLAFGIGIFQGGIQALSRSYFCKLAPPEKMSQFFGLYDIFNKSSNFIGSALFALITTISMGYLGNDATGVILSNRIAVACLASLFVVGLAIMFFIPANKADKANNLNKA